MEVTLKVMRDGRSVTVDVAADGEGLVSHAGSALLAQVADRLGLTGALSLRLEGLKQRRRGHDPGRVIGDLAVMLADGGECVSDLGTIRDQQALFGPVASDSTAFRVVDRVAAERLLGELRAAHARARERFCKLHGAPERLTIDIDATLITAHSTGLQKLLFKEFALNEVWLEIVLLAHDLIVWTQALLLSGELQNAEPKRLRYQLLHMAGRLAFSGRRAKLHLQRTWLWARELAAAFQRLKALPAAAG